MAAPGIGSGNSIQSSSSATSSLTQGPRYSGLNIAAPVAPPFPFAATTASGGLSLPVMAALAVAAVAALLLLRR